MDHYLTLEAGSREVPWQENPELILRIVEPDTLAKVTCACGLATDSIPRAEATAIVEEHLREMRGEG
ncbi:hypothetical protein ABZY44_13615 [Streptomyces sp. NPDC006544]|uniref:hypothetical protein n=1 Tax=Streptomyces sp. NPDC006544 TaxID=3154583 RepID=UPI0033B124B1